MNITVQNGFVLDGFEERAFPPEHPQFATMGWEGSFSEIPPRSLQGCGCNIRNN